MQASERLRCAQLQSLAPLVEKTDILSRDGRGKIICPEKLDVPLDENGIPRRVALMKAVLGTLETAHTWTGSYDVHHTAWEGARYRAIVDSDGHPLGALYRGCSSLKVTLPRQLHNYVHAITNEPPVPDRDTMRQYTLEHGQVNRLYDTVKVTSFADFPDLDALPDDRKDELRHESYLKKLSVMRDGELGVMPDREFLAQLELRQARGVLRAIARVQGLSNSRHAQRRFFLSAA